MLLIQSAGQVFTAGDRSLVEIGFVPVQSSSPVSTTVTFTDQPVVRETADVSANDLATTYNAGTLAITASATGGATAPTLSLLRQAGGGISLTVHGDVGATYEIQVSSDLLNWSALKTVTATGTDAQYVEQSLPSASLRFYRAQRLP